MISDQFDDSGVEPVLKGFRKRWTSGKRALEHESSGPPSEDLHGHPDVPFQPHLFGGSDVGSLDFADVVGDVDFTGHLDDACADSQNALKSCLEAAASSDGQPVQIQIVDPHRSEPTWKAAALAAEFKRARNCRDKLPWELEGSIFKSRDIWQGTAVSSLDKMFIPLTIGASDVMGSKVVATRAEPVLQEPDLRVMPIQLKRARREPLEEDIRRQALAKFRDIVLQDPMATQLGASLRGRFDAGTSHDDIDQSFRDCFRMKAAATLQKRASSLDKLATMLRSEGQLYPLRLSEPQLYSVLCRMRTNGSGATSAQHVIEALHFLDATAKLLIADLSDVISARCKGVARDMYLTKDPLRQKHPLTVSQVQWLERSMESANTVFQCVLGQLLFCIHACCRWKDSQRLKSVSLESGHGESLLFADALSSKTALTAEAKTRFLPYAAIGSGISAGGWAMHWLGAREHEGLQFLDFSLPSYSERQACWLDSPMSASEATIWLREFLEGSPDPFSPESIGSHSCKTTLLTWAGRSVKLVFTPSERRLLGHHLDANMKSVLCYSRESFTTLYAKVLSMFRMIRSGEFDPDQTALDRVVQMADDVDEAPLEGVQHEQAEDQVSDSESSVGSLDHLPGAEQMADKPDDRLVSLLPEFPGVPEASLLVHRISNLVHVVNEDDILSCGRPTSIHFKPYDQVSQREHLAACRQCLRSFQCRKA